MGRIFLSYAREDLRRAGKIAEALEAAGHEVWWDSRLKGGSEYSREIDEALKAADAVVVLWSRTSVNSEWVRDEAAVGKRSGRLVPARIDGTEPPLGFGQYHTIDLSSRSRSGVAQLLETVAEKAPAGEEGEAQQRQASRPRRRMVLIGGALAVMLAIAAAIVAMSAWPSAERKVSLAVLPFADLSPARDKAYFAEGVAEEILSSLAAEPGIKVLGRTSARQIEHGTDPRRLRRQLGVTHLLEGSARSDGDQLRVNVRLIDTSDGRQLWEEAYQGRPADVFSVQDQIAGAVAQRLSGTLARRNLRPALPTDAETFRTYLAARGVMRSRSQQGLNEAMTLAKEVVRRDPDYASGHALIAELYLMLSDDWRSYGTMPLAQARRLGTAHAKKAIRLAPDAADGYAALGLNQAGQESLPALQRAIELDPSRGELRTWMGLSLNEIGRHDDALVQYRAAADIDPIGFVTVNLYVHALAAAGQQRQALAVVRQFVARGGDQALEPTFMLQIAQWQADPSGVIEHGRKMLANERVRLQFIRLFVASALHALGERDESTRALLPMQDLHAPYYTRDLQLLRRNIANAGPKLWKRADGGIGFLHLAYLRDWPALVRLYDQRGSALAVFCGESANAIVPLVLALRARDRSDDASRVIGCLRKRLAVELRNKARLPQDWPGDLEFRRAGLAMLDGDPEGSIGWLERSVGRGWLGQPYSSRIGDYPQFDSLRGEPRLLALQRRIDRKIAVERAEMLALT